jgi:hypothetical protein
MSEFYLFIGYLCATKSIGSPLSLVGLHYPQPVSHQEVHAEDVVPFFFEV